MTQLREKLLRWKEHLLPKHPMAEAVNYPLGQWTELMCFVPTARCLSIIMSANGR